MKVVYDPHTDTLTLELRAGPVAESDERTPGVILDYDAEGRVVGIEILDASKQVTEARRVEFQVAG
jgi:YD repeat-containing protein